MITTVTDGWHQWLGPDPTSDQMRSYLEAHPEYEELLIKSYLHAQAYSSDGVRIVDICDVGTESNPDQNHYSISDVRGYIAQPLQVIVENEVADGDFYWRFIRVVDSALAELFNLPIAPVKFSQAGGVTEVIRLVDRRASDARRRNARPRIVALADSDAKYPGHENSEYNRLSAVCKRHGIPFHLTEKRSLENYIPDRVFLAFINDHPEAESAVTFITGLTEKQRDHYPVKSGLPKEPTDGEKALYHDLLAEPTQENYKVKRIAEYFRNEFAGEISSVDLVERACFEELRQISEMIRREL